MYALLDQQNKVVACVTPEATDEELAHYQTLGTLIQMTVENSPAYIGGIYDGKRFYERTQ